MVSKLDEIAAFFATVHAAGVMPLSVGGDHSISLPILRAIARDRPLGLVHIDAHCDTGDDYLGSRFHHGASFRGTVEEGLIDPKRVVQIGIRGSLSTITLWQFSYGRWNARSLSVVNTNFSSCRRNECRRSAPVAGNPNTPAR